MNGNFCKIFCKNVKKYENLLFFVLFYQNFAFFVCEKKLVEFFSCVFVELNLSCVFCGRDLGIFGDFVSLKAHIRIIVILSDSEKSLFEFRDISLRLI